MRRNLLVVALGISFLILMTWAGTLITTIVPHRATPQVQTARAGPYQVTLEVRPNPPPITRPAAVLVQVMRDSPQQPVVNANVTLASSMESMDMGTDLAQGYALGGGTYRTSVQFSMSGSWQVVVNVAVPGAPPASTTFEIVAG
jgi:hypothetical protein